MVFLAADATQHAVFLPLVCVAMALRTQCLPNYTERRSTNHANCTKPGTMLIESDAISLNAEIWLALLAVS